MRALPTPAKGREALGTQWGQGADGPLWVQGDALRKLYL
jgi:hypothetical protein